MLKCLIIDDENHAIELLTDYIQNVSFLKLENTTNDPIIGLKLINEGNYDIIFLDVEMPKITGLELLAGITQKSKVVITSANRNYAADGYENEVFDFLLKPIRFERFLKVVQKVFNTTTKETTNTKEDFIFVKLETKNRLKKILYDHIVYIEGAGNYITIHTITEKITTYLTLRDFEELVPSEKFMRVQKSYVVAIAKITGLEGNELVLENNKAVLVGESYRQKVNEFFGGFMNKKKSR
ncbi:LytTR family DNA-binding domain-containing protein [Arcicella sp. LKC2W]|uniref:LytR/AlgR family response regulator transcription factor n=1 Tax=Arcicella sp. LKC2W TaxID=2984198 RepID=UPI002B1F7724|nr:LytTR family DNA-binding domain-containing protein [Arcicella sp. LKC2W]MEA5461124.1 LytTR family DNA-binding domain-containing protein [Arcicella sp. LKC2W]